MYMNLSGSSFNNIIDDPDNPVVGSLHFYQNGEVGTSFIEEHKRVSFTDIASLVFTTEFLMYALEKESWMYEYMQKTRSHLEDFEKILKKEKFQVIEGGLTDGPSADTDA
jgi:hypothetical protein